METHRKPDHHTRGHSVYTLAIGGVVVHWGPLGTELMAHCESVQSGFFVKIGQIRLIEQFDKRKEIVYTIFNKAVGR